MFVPKSVRLQISPSPFLQGSSLTSLPPWSFFQSSSPTTSRLLHCAPRSCFTSWIIAFIYSVSLHLSSLYSMYSLRQEFCLGILSSRHLILRHLCPVQNRTSALDECWINEPRRLPFFFTEWAVKRQCKKTVARNSLVIIPIQHLLALKLGERTLTFLTSVSSTKLNENSWTSFKEGSPHEMFGKAFSKHFLQETYQDQRDQSHQHKNNYKGTFDFCNIDQNSVNIQERSSHVLPVTGFNTRKS